MKSDNAAPTGDSEARQRALDPNCSFIVQAPAGSGKTELLTLRFLRLLARVDEPEEILAITFTRKAASEMRARVLEALGDVEGAEPTAPHERQRRALAMAVRRRDREYGWGLRENPARLDISTIDALCNRLAARMPLMGDILPAAEITNDAGELYLEAARNAIAHVENETLPGHEAALAVLERMQNRAGTVAERIADMLGKRDQWLPAFAAADTDVAERLDANLREAVKRRLQGLAGLAKEALAPVEWKRLLEMLEEARGRLGLSAAEGSPEGDEDSSLLRLRAHPEKWEELPCWQALAQMLLTKGKSLRKRFTEREGFPKELKNEKANLMELVEKLRAGEHGRAFAEKLADCQQCPPSGYGEEMLQFLGHFIRLLKIAVGELSLVFRERGTLDHCQRALDAQRVLDIPTGGNLVLALDRRIQHIFVDEFQDSSPSQVQLLRQLTGGWSDGDGRTLFAVGDPMQSIYLFRKADVGLFASVRDRGLDAVAPTRLALSSNFRSRSEIVEWCNQHLSQLFPETEDLTSGRISFLASTSSRGSGGTVNLIPVAAGKKGEDLEAEAVAAAVARLREEQPQWKIALLMLHRRTLPAIERALSQRGLEVHAPRMHGLKDNPVAQSLLALARALLHPADRIAWLAVLRAPYCGLSLEDLYRLAGSENHSRDPSLVEPIEQLLDDPERLSKLSADGQTRIARVWPLLRKALSERRQQTLARAVEGLWLGLGGPAVCSGADDLEAAELFFSELREYGAALANWSLPAFEKRLQEARRSSGSAQAPIEALTIHGAKGLEFDAVVLCGLGKKGREYQGQLVEWNTPSALNLDSCLLAPRPDVAAEEPIYQFICELNKEKDANEQARLLYVAMTRARERLLITLPYSLEPSDEEKIKLPPKNTLLRLLWSNPHLSCLCQQHASETGADAGEPLPVEDAEQARPRLQLRRLPASWQRPAPETKTLAAAVDQTPEQPVRPQFLWAKGEARALGTIVHEALERIAEEGAEKWPMARLQGLEALMRTRLFEEGVSGQRLDAQVADALLALERTLADGRGRWLLAADHEDVHSEYSLDSIEKSGRLRQVRIDRTFIADGCRWIVDFKLSRHEGSDLEAFLDEERERYRDQLEGYAELWHRRGEDGGREIRLGLYFPLISGWREWPAA